MFGFSTQGQTLPECNDFATDNGRAIYRQWENGILSAVECRIKLDDANDSIMEGQFGAMCREEADAAHCDDERDCDL